MKLTYDSDLNVCGCMQEPPVTLKSEDVIWMDPSPEYGGVADMYRTLRHPVLGTPCCILPRSPCAANHYLLFDEGKLVRSCL